MKAPHVCSCRRWQLAVLMFVALDLWWANARSNPDIAANFYDPRGPVDPARVFWPDPQNEQLPQAAFDLYLPLNDYRAAAQHEDAYRNQCRPYGVESLRPPKRPYAALIPPSSGRGKYRC